MSILNSLGRPHLRHQCNRTPGQSAATWQSHSTVGRSLTSSPMSRMGARLQASKEDEPAAAPAANSCPTCGIPLSEAPRGCDREGRVAGGVGAVLGFDWWPIKAYKPCPELAKGGLSYIRKGQITDDILFPKELQKRQ